jgi:outer membrane protein OmpA-like peptidoglycan-associated protein
MLIVPSVSIVGADTLNIGDLLAVAGGGFNAVSCATATQCTAVGFDPVNNEPFYATESSGTWSDVVEIDSNFGMPGAPADVLTSIDCVDVMDCSAVGYEVTSSTYYPISISEIGGVWSPLDMTSTPNSESVFTGVSCWSVGNCTAVGGGVFGEGPIYESEIDGTWEGGLDMPSSLPGVFLTSVSCPDALDCTATGHDENDLPIAIGDVAGTWGDETALPLPGDVYASLNGVSCATAVDCVAVGSDDESNEPVEFTEIGGNWSAGVDLPTPGVNGVFNSVSCTSPGNCSAVGSDATANEPSSDFEVAGSWLPGTDYVAPGGSGFFAGVSCVLVASCVAVGQDEGVNEPMYDNAVAPRVSTLPPPPQTTVPTTTTTTTSATTTTTTAPATTSTTVPPVSSSHMANVTVHFSRDSSTLSRTDDVLLRRFARSVVERRFSRVAIVGYASLSGTAASTQRLSLRRANAAATDLRRLFRSMSDTSISISVRSGRIGRSPTSSANRRATASSTTSHVGNG